MKKTLHQLLAFGAAIAALPQIAQAVPSLRLFDGTTTITIADNGAGDASAAVGHVVFVGAIGNFTLNVDSGTTFPALGSLANPALDLTYSALSTGTGGTLQVMFSADGFGPTNGTANAHIGGTTLAGGSVTYRTYGGTNNTLFSTANLLTSQGPFGPVAYSDAAVGGTVSSAGPYALTQIVTLTHAAGTVQSTGDALLQVPDGGLTALLLGTALMGIGMIGRFTRKHT